jgi:hypothetical protein
LEQVAGRISDGDDKYYFLKVTSFDDPKNNDICFNSNELVSEKAFENPSFFSLIYAEFFMGENHAPVFAFSMGENICKIELLVDLNSVNEEEFKLIFPGGDVSSLTSWRFVLALFISRINTITLNKVKITVIEDLCEAD